MKQVTAIITGAVMIFSAMVVVRLNIDTMAVRKDTIIENQTTQLTDENLSSDNNTDEIINIFYCGADSTLQLTDVMGIASYNVTDNQLSVLQIPRDTYVGDMSVTGKINSIYNQHKSHEKGIASLVSSVEEILPINIDYSVVVFLEGFSSIIDTLGGVEIDIPYDIEFLPNQILYKGLQTINGTQSQWLVRYREGYGTGDIGRMEMQRYFMTALAKTLKEKSYSQLISLIPKCLDYVYTDIPLSLIMRLAPKAVDITVDSIKIESLEGTGQVYNNQWIYKINKDASAEILNSIFSKDVVKYTGKDINTP